LERTGENACAASKCVARLPVRDEQSDMPRKSHGSRQVKAKTKHTARAERADSLSTLVSEALRKKLNDIADPKSGRTYGELIAERLVEDALSGKLPAQVVGRLFEGSESKPTRGEEKPLAERSTEELKYFVKHGRWPGKANMRNVQ
jgi:hypothetical protein